MEEGEDRDDRVSHSVCMVARRRGAWIRWVKSQPKVSGVFARKAIIITERKGGGIFQGQSR